LQVQVLLCAPFFPWEQGGFEVSKAITTLNPAENEGIELIHSVLLVRDYAAIHEPFWMALKFLGGKHKV